MRKPETLAEAEGWKGKTIVDKWGCRHVVTSADECVIFGIYLDTVEGTELRLEDIN